MFELLRYGKSEVLKNNTYYLSNSGSKIEEKEHVRDLGIRMSNTANFDHHINVTIESARQLSGWILRNFKCREPKVMITLWKSLVVPKLEYCLQFWSPLKTGEIQRLEIVQWTYPSKIKDLHYPDYWECLKKFKLYSLQRRRERVSHKL